MIGKPNIVVIVGPTGSGKTDLAIRLAKAFNGELIAADSRTVYRGMDIGTAKPARGRKQEAGSVSAYIVDGVPHHLLDIRDPDQSYSVAEFKADAERLVTEITARGKLPIVVGGTGLYIRALVDNLTLPALPAQPKLRESFERRSLSELLTLLHSLDPAAARTIDRKNKRRVIRALEVCVFTGHAFSALRTKGEPKFDSFQVGIARSRATLYRRIDRRIRQMFRSGLMYEVRQLLARYGPGIEPLRGIIYREVVDWLHEEQRGGVRTSPSFNGRENRGRLPGRRALRELQQCVMFSNHRYARHQLMWFRKDKRIHWVRTPVQAERLVRKWSQWKEPHASDA